MCGLDQVMRYNAQQPLKITASKGKEPVPDSTSGLAGGAPKSGLLSNTRKRIIQRDKGPVLTRQKTYCKPVLEGRSWGKRTQDSSACRLEVLGLVSSLSWVSHLALPVFGSTQSPSAHLSVRMESSSRLSEKSGITWSGISYLF